MKKTIYTLFAAAAAFILFTSNSGGVAASQGEGLTGAPGDAKLANGNAKTCQSCHSGGSFNPTATIETLDEAGTVAVTKYEPGKTYTIRLTINAGSGTPVGYGFQMIDIRKSNDANVKGFLANQTSNIQLSTLSNGRVYAEHSERSASKTFNVKWKAPSTSVGTVVFYAVGNAVNGTGGSSGDNGTASVKVELSELTSNVNELATQVIMSVSPNPTTEGVVLSLSSKVSKNIKVRFTDISGRVHISDYWQIQTGDNTKEWNVSRLPKGAYMIQIVDNQEVISKKIIKI